VKERLTAAFVTPFVPGVVAGFVEEVETEVALAKESRRMEAVAEPEMDPRAFFRRSFSSSSCIFLKMGYIGRRLCFEKAFFFVAPCTNRSGPLIKRIYGYNYGPVQNISSVGKMRVRIMLFHSLLPID
jgi:hypothetical protein